MVTPVCEVEATLAKRSHGEAGDSKFGADYVYQGGRQGQVIEERTEGVEDSVL